MSLKKQCDRTLQEPLNMIELSASMILVLLKLNPARRELGDESGSDSSNLQQKTWYQTSSLCSGLEGEYYNTLFLSFSGIDGSGKTRHAEALKEKFIERGIPCKIIWARWRPIITYPLMGMIYVLKGYRRKDYHKSKILSKIWAYLTILDYVYIYLSKIKYNLREGGILICDRYIYDHIVELMCNGLYNEGAEKLLLRLIPNPREKFIFDVPTNISLKRKGNTRYMLNTWHFDISAEEYLSKQRENYLQIAKKLNIPVISTIGEFTNLNNKIYDYVFSRYVNRRRTKTTKE